MYTVQSLSDSDRQWGPFASLDAAISKAKEIVDTDCAADEEIIVRHGVIVVWRDTEDYPQA